MLDVLIKNALIVDGTGRPAYRGSVGVRDGMIAFVRAEPDSGPDTSGTGTGMAAETGGIAGADGPESRDTVDGAGLICCPGFIDVHSHADVTLPFYPEMTNLIAQGITTFVGGNCGIAVAPAPRRDFTDAYFGALGMPDLDVRWHTFAEWLDFARTQPIRANYVPLAGFNAIRGGAIGPDFERAATDEERLREQELLEEALAAGAYGMSLSYDAGVPGHYASPEEIHGLFGILEDAGRLATAHTRHHQNQWPSPDNRTYYGVYRGYPGDIICGRYHGFVEFTEQFMRFPKLRVLISHLTNAFILPQPHSQALEDAMLDETLHQFVDEPARQGMDVHFNLLPSAISISSAARTVANLVFSLQYKPALQAYANPSAFIKGLSDPVFRSEMKRFINSGFSKIGMICPATDPYWADNYTFLKCADESIVGRTLLDIARERTGGSRSELIYENCLDILFDIVVRDPDTMWALTRDKREYMAYERLLLHPRSMPCTDVIAFPELPDLSRNIMSYGTPLTAYSMMCRYLTGMVRDGGRLSLEEAVRKITSLPADVLGIRKRGRLETGSHADITLLDLNGMTCGNDFLKPFARPTGIAHVLVNGAFAVRDGKMAGGAAGRVL